MAGEITSEEKRTHLASPLKAGPRQNRSDSAILTTKLSSHQPVLVWQG